LAYLSLLLSPSPPVPSRLSLHDALPIYPDACLGRCSLSTGIRCPSDAFCPDLETCSPQGTCSSNGVCQGPGISCQHVIVFYSTADRKSTRLNSSHVSISYAVFCLKKKTK